jgi:putative alpha-1,2-mannosidase
VIGFYPVYPASDEYVSMRFNRSAYTKNFLNHDELMKGAVIDVKMSDRPNKKRGIDKEEFPYSFSTSSHVKNHRK